MMLRPWLSARLQSRGQFRLVSLVASARAKYFMGSNSKPRLQHRLGLQLGLGLVWGYVPATCFGAWAETATLFVYFLAALVLRHVWGAVSRN